MTPAEDAALREVAQLTEQANAKGEGFKNDKDKLRYDLLPMGPVADVVRVLAYGARKYADWNWQKVPGRRSRYYAAAMRHIIAWWDGEKLDSESGLPHLAHAGCCILFLMWDDQQEGSK